MRSTSPTWDIHSEAGAYAAELGGAYGHQPCLQSSKKKKKLTHTEHHQRLVQSITPKRTAQAYEEGADH